MQNYQAFKSGGFTYLVPEYIGNMIATEFQKTKQLTQGVAQRFGQINFIGFYDSLNADQKASIYRFVDSFDSGCVPVHQFKL